MLNQIILRENPLADTSIVDKFVELVGTSKRRDWTKNFCCTLSTTSNLLS